MPIWGYFTLGHETKREKTTVEAHCWDLIRDGLDRYLNNRPYKKGIHIATDPAFQQSNEMLDAKLKVYMTDIFLFARLNLPNVLISVAQKIFR